MTDSLKNFYHSQSVFSVFQHNHLYYLNYFHCSVAAVTTVSADAAAAAVMTTVHPVVVAAVV